MHWIILTVVGFVIGRAYIPSPTDIPVTAIPMIKSSFCFAIIMSYLFFLLTNISRLELSNAYKYYSQIST
jgi:hypothetical protein